MYLKNLLSKFIMVNKGGGGGKLNNITQSIIILHAILCNCNKNLHLQNNKCAKFYLSRWFSASCVYVSASFASCSVHSDSPSSRFPATRYKFLIIFIRFFLQKNINLPLQLQNLDNRQLFLSRHTHIFYFSEFR